MLAHTPRASETQRRHECVAYLAGWVTATRTVFPYRPQHNGRVQSANQLGRAYALAASCKINTLWARGWRQGLRDGLAAGFGF
jgi:hypothetical protein